MFAPRIRFVDLETTGADPSRERITEVGIVAVDIDGDSVRVTEWSSLVNPGRPIPATIRGLTGIDESMVRDAPPFAAIADDVLERLRDGLFVAHNAHFDYGFLRAEFERAGLALRVPMLCTVRLSRLLFPDRGSHSLDAIIERFGIDGEPRHRALGDARAIWRFSEALYRRLPRAEIDAAVERLLARPSSPTRLPPEALDEAPPSPGVYLLYGPNPHPIYIGKSRDLRARLASHFAPGVRSERDARLIREVERIEWEGTAGELGALLREAQLVKERLPAQNIKLRRRLAAVVMSIDEHGRAHWHATGGSVPLPAGGGDLLFGPFSSRNHARRVLESMAPDHGLCLRALGVERAGRSAPLGTPCFNHQLKRCRGACVGSEGIEQHRERLLQALEWRRIPRWPFGGPIAIVEHAARGGREDWHVADAWCWLGTARSAIAAGDLARHAERLFDGDVYAILRKALGIDGRGYARTEVVAI
ncbi:MAG TPA: exonuclease domain-containing protein [Burkholderiaceae bacterium]|nr:exonuclease domain-containing protein [Burkholderiaceae bacterium]